MCIRDRNATGSASSNEFYLGQDTLGGIVFHIYIGNDGQQHGLIVNPYDTSGVRWMQPNSATGATSSWDGKTNTALMTSTNPAAQAYVQSLSTGGFTDWYLPAIDELSILWQNRMHANKGLDNGGYTLLVWSGNNIRYWSSTENTATQAFYLDFVEGIVDTNLKSSTIAVSYTHLTLPTSDLV